MVLSYGNRNDNPGKPVFKKIREHIVKNRMLRGVVSIPLISLLPPAPMWLLSFWIKKIGMDR